MPPIPMPRTKIDSRAELMRRRLNACGKGLLESHVAGHLYLADATVEYLHRTVRDFIRRPDIWSKLLEATTLGFDPALHLAVSEIARIKIIEIPTDSNVTLVFWNPFITSILNIVRYGPPSLELQIRFLNELEMAAEAIMTRGLQGSPITYHSCPLSTASNVFDISSFLHLAVKLQLNTYVKAVAIRLHRTRQIDLLSSLFQMAATEYETTNEAFKYQYPSLHMIETFLELGVNPNQRSQPLRDGNMTIWEMVISDTATRTGILKLCLRYGANPFVPQLNSYNEHGRDDLREFLEATREEARRKGTKWDHAESTGNKSTSKWSRIRYQQLFRSRLAS
jgi:hypothetical protein